MQPARSGYSREFRWVVWSGSALRFVEPTHPRARFQYLFHLASDADETEST